MGLSPLAIVIQVFASNLGAYVGGILTLQAEKVAWIKANIIPDGPRTWLMLMTWYSGIQLLISPELRDWGLYLRMGFPLLMTTGLVLSSLFGKTQDWIVRRSQRRESEQALSAL